MERINIETAAYGDIVEFAKSRGYVQSGDAHEQEAQGCYGTTLDEAVDYLISHDLAVTTEFGNSMRDILAAGGPR